MAVRIVDLTDRSAVLSAIAECDALGRDEFLDRYGFDHARAYFLEHRGRRYDSKAIAGVAYGKQFSGAPTPAADDFSGGDATVARTLRALGFTVLKVPENEISVEEERARRDAMWQVVLAAPEPEDLPPGLLRELGIYGGAQGVWVDAARTQNVAGASAGVTVGVLHTGRHYADDLTAEGVIYHYPSTGRAGSRDQSEIEATKNAHWLSLPIFVVKPGRKSTTRSVARGWVDEWDDAGRLFLVSFAEAPANDPVPEVGLEDEAPFLLKDAAAPKITATTTARPGQTRFKFEVLRRYGSRCAVCSLEIIELLDAAHLCSKRDKGTDDPRNGLPLCAIHHRALDAGLFGIDPDTFALRVPDDGPSLSDLRITRSDLSHLKRPPHADALRHLWRYFDKT